jgi:hypothetical protein
MSSRLPWLLAALLMAALLFALDHYGRANHLYFYHWWFDVVMHLLGGATIGIFSVGLLGRFQPRAFLLLTMGAALSWEAFEYFAGISTSQPGFVYDTAHDLLNDALGAAGAYVLARYTVWR